MRSVSRGAWAGVALISAIASCDRSPQPSAATPSASARGAAASAAPSAAEPKPPTIASVAATGAAAPSAAPPPLLAPSRWAPPDQPSKPPTVNDWRDAAETEVKNAKRLGCEVKTVREWLRVSCRSTPDSGSQIQSLRWLRPEQKPADFYDLVRAGSLASIVLPIRHDTDVRVEFVWSEFKRTLTLQWKRGFPVPLVYFNGEAPGDLSKPTCVSVCGLPYFPGRGSMPCPATHDPTGGEDNGCICRKYRDEQCTNDW